MSDFLSPDSGSSLGPTVVPHNREAEEAVIGAVLINPESYYDVAQFLRSDDFYIHRHGWIWDAFTRLHERRVPIDFLTVSTELDQMGQLAEIGGPAYLTALINNVPTSLHAEAYGRLVEQTAIRRKMLEAANQIAKLAYQEESGVEAVMDEAEKAVFGVSERRLTRDLQSIQQVLSDYYDRIDQLSQRDEEIFGVPTGFIDLDRLLGGLQSSDFLLIAGRPGTGKSAFMHSVAKNAAQTYKKHVAIFSLEMSNEQVVQRLISQETGIDSHHLRTGKLTEEEWPLFTHAVEVLGDTHIFLDDTPSLTPLQLRTKARRLHLEYRLDLVLVDYLQLMSGGMRIENRVQEVSYISRNLKVLARELNIPVMAAAQLSRAIEQRTDKEPQLSDLRESGCLIGDTCITLADSGQIIPLRELEGKDNFCVWALNQQTLKLEKTLVSRVFSTGVKPVLKLTTRLGRSIHATGNHRFFTIRGWKRLDELVCGDHIALPRTIPNCGTGLYKQNVSRVRADKIAQVVKSDELFALAQSEIYWDSITAIEFDGEEQVYDMTVPGHHNFVADNFIVHNSLEQDADIVMFIHRPELYEKDTLKQNLAQIKVSKHRNGPVGTIELVFRSNLTRFENAATRQVDLSRVK